jgi:hypothetical protein
MLHPPFDASRDRELRQALKALEGDAFLMGVIRHHNPSFGYNSFDSFVEEDCVRALEQLIGERLKVEREARRRWEEEDDGIHILAAVIYGLMKQENYNGSRETFRDFLLRILKTGKLAPGKIRQLYQSFYSATRVERRPALEPRQDDLLMVKGSHQRGRGAQLVADETTSMTLRLKGMGQRLRVKGFEFQQDEMLKIHPAKRPPRSPTNPVRGLWRRPAPIPHTLRIAY